MKCICHNKSVDSWVHAMLSHREVSGMSGVTGHRLGLTEEAVAGSCWFRGRFGCRLWCWFRCRLGWCRFWRRAWTWLNRGVVDLELVAPIPTTRADGNLKIKMSLEKELLVEYLLLWLVIDVNVDTHSTSFWGLWQVPLGLLDTGTSTSN